MKLFLKIIYQGKMDVRDGNWVNVADIIFV